MDSEVQTKSSSLCPIRNELVFTQQGSDPVRSAQNKAKLSANFCKWLHFSESLKQRGHMPFKTQCQFSENRPRDQTGRGPVMILSHPKRWLRKCKYQVKANFQGTGGLGQPVGIRTALEVGRKHASWRDVATSGNSRQQEMLVEAAQSRGGGD